MPRRIDPYPIMMLLGFVVLCLLVAAAHTMLIGTAMHAWYPALRHPPGTLPGWVLQLVWIPLYLVMAVAVWRVWRCSPSPAIELGRRPAQGPAQGWGGLPGQAAGRVVRRPDLRRRGLLLWGWQLGVNALWTPVLFGLHRPVAALGLVVLLGMLVLLTLLDFRRVDRLAGQMMAPYLAWVCYATWLTAGIAWLNPS